MLMAIHRDDSVHTNRTDHVCGTVGLVRSGSRWLLDAFHLDTCPGSDLPKSAAGDEGGD